MKSTAAIEGDANPESVREFYDGFADSQREKGVNPRHHRILDWTLRAGLKSDHRVLEVGCGVGTFTSLLIGQVSAGRVVSIDISPRSIDMAKAWLGHHANLEFHARDPLASGAVIGGPYDMIVLPDVLEHIPLEAHGKLLSILAQALAPDGAILIHSPSAQYMEWLRATEPERLQVIDLPIHLDELLAQARAAGLYADQVEHYSLWTEKQDAMAIVLRPAATQVGFALKAPALNVFERARAWLHRRVTATT